MGLGARKAKDRLQTPRRQGRNKEKNSLGKGPHGRREQPCWNLDLGLAASRLPDSTPLSFSAHPSPALHTRHSGTEPCKLTQALRGKGGGRSLPSAVRAGNEPQETTGAIPPPPSRSGRDSPTLSGTLPQLRAREITGKSFLELTQVLHAAGAVLSGNLHGPPKSGHDT